VLYYRHQNLIEFCLSCVYQLDVTFYFILLHFLCAQHVSYINISTIRSLRLFWWITTLVVLFLVQASACNTDTTRTQPYRNSNTHLTKNNATNVVIQQNSCKLLMMDILMSETCWAHKKWNKIASDIKLVFILQLSQLFIWSPLYKITKHARSSF